MAPEEETRLRDQLELVVSSRVGEDQVAWTIFSVFWAAQVLLIGVLFQRSDFPPPPVSGLVVSIVGILMSSAWWVTQDRSLLHLERFEDLTRSIEDQLRDANRLHPDHRLTMARRFHGPRARDIMRMCSLGAALSWLGSAVVFLVLL
jgi:hypothetical protein